MAHRALSVRCSRYLGRSSPWVIPRVLCALSTSFCMACCPTVISTPEFVTFGGPLAMSLRRATRSPFRWWGSRSSDWRMMRS